MRPRRDSTRRTSGSATLCQGLNESLGNQEGNASRARLQVQRRECAPEVWGNGRLSTHESSLLTLSAQLTIHSHFFSSIDPRTLASPSQQTLDRLAPHNPVCCRVLHHPRTHALGSTHPHLLRPSLRDHGACFTQPSTAPSPVCHLHARAHRAICTLPLLIFSGDPAIQSQHSAGRSCLIHPFVHDCILNTHLESLAVCVYARV